MSGVSVVHKYCHRRTFKGNIGDYSCVRRLIPHVYDIGVEKVKVELYSEALCPFCAQFIVNRLNPFFNNGLIDIVELRIIPYGNARIIDGSLTCQVRVCCWNLLIFVVLLSAFLYQYESHDKHACCLVTNFATGSG